MSSSRHTKPEYRPGLPWITSLKDEPPLGWLPKEHKLNVVKEDDLPTDFVVPPKDPVEEE